MTRESLMELLETGISNYELITLLNFPREQGQILRSKDFLGSNQKNGSQTQMINALLAKGIILKANRGEYQIKPSVFQALEA